MIKKLSESWRQQKNSTRSMMQRQPSSTINDLSPVVVKQKKEKILEISDWDFTDSILTNAETNNSDSGKQRSSRSKHPPTIKHTKTKKTQLKVSILKSQKHEETSERVSNSSATKTRNSAKRTEQTTQLKVSLLKSQNVSKMQETNPLETLSPISTTRTAVDKPIKICKKDDKQNDPVNKMIENDNLVINKKKENKNDPLINQGSISMELNTDSVECELSNWGLPANVLEQYRKNGIVKLFPWQQECLLTGKALDGGNLVYSAPTSAGKTLVAEFLMLKRVLETKKKVFYILPFVSVAREKVSSLQNQFEESGVRVGGFMGSENPTGGLKMVDIAVCTIEKANSLFNKLMEAKQVFDLSCVVVDEMHMLGDAGRGYLLELLLTKIKYLSSEHENTIQIIGMSATLPNLEMLASWIEADLYFTTFRPVPLSEHIKVGAKIYSGEGKEVSTINDLGAIKGDEEGIIPLCVETIVEGNSVLIFCPTKNWCEKLSDTIASYFSQNPDGPCKDRINKTAIGDVIEQLQRSPVGLDETLERVVGEGVAYHHAGLTYDERDIVEGAFRRGVLKVLVATSTLSSGVNLPARRVIIRSPIFHGRLLDSLVYKQMAGRAGRKNVDERGESIIVCKPTEKQKALSLVTSHLNPVYSCLLGSTEGDSKSLKRALLEVIAAGVVSKPQHIQLYAQSTYLHTCLTQLPGRNADKAIIDAMKFLLDNEFIRLDNKEEGEERYFSTQLGSATLSSSLSPDEALLVFRELQEARKSFVLENELHIIYQVTPIYLQDQWPDPDWFTYNEIWEKLSTSYKQVAELVGVQERFLARAMRNRIVQKTDEQIRRLRIHKRFYAALILQDLVNEVPLSRVSFRYKVNRGLLQSLQNSASTFAGMVTVFCQKLGWTCLVLLLDQFQSRLSFGVSRELCNLVRIPLLNGFKARMLYENGYQTVSALANAPVDSVSKLLRDCVPFESKQGSKVMKRHVARNIWLPGQEGLTEQEAACLVIREAKRILVADAAMLGIPINPNLIKSPIREEKPEIRPNSSEKQNKDKTSGSKKRPASKDFKENVPLKRISPNKGEGKQKSYEVIDTNAIDQNILPAPRLKIPEPKTEEITEREEDIKHKDDDNIKSKDNENIKLEDNENIKRDDNENIELEDNKHIKPKGESSPIKNDVKVGTSIELVAKDTSIELVDEISAGQKRKSSSLLFSDTSPFLINSPDLIPTAPHNKQNISNDSLISEKKYDASLSCPLDFSLRIEENDDIIIVPPLKLASEFEAVSNETSPRKDFNKMKAFVEPLCAEEFGDSLMIDSKLLGNNSPKKPRNSPKLLANSPLIDDGLLGNSLIVDSKLLGNCSTITENKLLGNSLMVDTKLLENNGTCNLSQNEFLIIDVATQTSLFLTFLQELKQQKLFSFCLACESVAADKSCAIGRNIKTKTKIKVQKACAYANNRLRIVGMAFCWGLRDAYFLNLEECPTAEEQQRNLNNTTSSPPDVSRGLLLKYRINSLQKLLEKKRGQAIAFDIKHQLKLWYKMTEGLLDTLELRDPKVAHWLLNSNDRDKGLHDLISHFMEGDLLAIVEATGSCFGVESLGMALDSTCDARMRACVEAVAVYSLHKELESRLVEEQMIEPYAQIEMPTIRTLLVIELNGMGFSSRECERIKDILKGKQESIESECYSLAGHTFSLTSTEAVARVLFHELGLPPSGDFNAVVTRNKTHSKKLKGLSTAKCVLEKLVLHHRLPKLILEWRKVNSALTKVVYPVQRLKSTVDHLSMDRVFSEAQFRTCTGRVSFSEPNLQMVPKQFDIKLPCLIGESPPVQQKGSRRHKKKLVSATRIHTQRPSATSPGDVFAVSMRSTFVPFDAGVMLAADYCQLELRLIAHLSQDKKLIDVLNCDGDVFKSIAAEVNHISVDEVNSVQRQQAKQICYGIIYGMGARALGETLGVDENEAGVYMEQFKDRYAGVRSYIRKTIEEASINGYVKTLGGRRRYLPQISSLNGNMKSQAERQAVNTTVQGSGADLVKIATNNISDRLLTKFGGRCFKPRSSPPPGAYLVLQLHDELIYEVNRQDLNYIIALVRREMERALTLSVRLPVTIKTGSNWGNLK